LIFGCCINEPYIGSLSETIIKEIHLPYCAIVNNKDILNSNGILITTDSTYTLFKNSVLSRLDNAKDSFEFECKQNFPIIDFSKFSIIGKPLIVKGCNIYFDKKVTLDHSKRIVKYSLTKRNCGRCKENSGFSNLVLIEATPSNYKLVVEID
jgi:hypothetical protein